MAREGCRRTANRGWLASHASLNKSPDGVAVASCRAYVLGYDHAPRPNRLLSRREAQGAPSEVVEVGDLSRRKSKRGGAVRYIFPDDDGGQ